MSWKEILNNSVFSEAGILWERMVCDLGIELYCNLNFWVCSNGVILSHANFWVFDSTNLVSQHILEDALRKDSSWSSSWRTVSHGWDPTSLSWSMSLWLYFLSPVQRSRGVTERLWWAPGVQPGSTYHTLLWAGGWTRWVPGVPSDLNYFVGLFLSQCSSKEFIIEIWFLSFCELELFFIYLYLNVLEISLKSL